MIENAGLAWVTVGGALQIKYNSTMENKNSISLVMIVKNEEKGLERAILSCKDFVDKILISVDSLSTDRTLKIAKRLADKVIIHKWENDFSKARNNLQQYVKTKWTLSLDGHEYVKEYSNLKQALESDVDGLLVMNEWESGFSFLCPRIYKSHLKWRMPVHNYIPSKTSKVYKEFVIIHDRIHLQTEEAVKERGQQRHKMVFGILHKRIKKNKKDHRSLFYLAQQYRSTGKAKKAIKYYKQYLKYSPSEQEKWLARYYIGTSFNLLNKPKKAIKFFKSAEKELIDRWEISKRVGTTYMLLAKWKEALDHLVDSFKINKGDYHFYPEHRNDAQTWFFVSQCFFALRKYEEAKIALRRSLVAQTTSPWGQLPEEQIRIAETILSTQELSRQTGPIPTNKDTIIEVCFLVYQRPHRVPKILAQLKAQTIQNFKVNIWNCSGKELDLSNFPEDRIQIINSKERLGSYIRFQLVKKTSGNPIIFFDDDMYLYPDFVQYNYEQYLKFGPKCILGWHTRTFDQESYWKSTGATYGQEVDYVGTVSMVLDRKIIDEEPLLQNIPTPFVKVEDLYLCYLARVLYGMKMIKISPSSRMIYDGKDQYPTVDKEKAFRELRKIGWWLLKDNIRNFGGFTFKIRKGQWDEAILMGETDPKYYQIPKNPKIVVDIGAHIGGTAILAASLGAEVYAYEPEKENFKLLKENIKLNGLKIRIHCFQTGVGTPGKRKLYLNPKNSGAATLEPSENETQEINVIGIDKVFEKIDHCDLLKIDAEGAEYEFIFITPFEKIDQISMELHKGPQQIVLNQLKKFYTVRTKPSLDRNSLMVFCHKTTPLKEQALRNLTDFKQTMDALKIPFCLMCGTLLGAYRDNDFIKNDYDDVDIGIPEKYHDKAPLIFAALEKKGFQKLKEFCYKEKSQGGSAIRNGNHVDFCFIHIKGKEAYHLGRNFLPNNPKPYWACVFPAHCFQKFDKLTFKNMEFNIPHQVEDYLEACYGNWKKPCLKGEGYNWRDPKQNPCFRFDYEI